MCCVAFSKPVFGVERPFPALLQGARLQPEGRACIVQPIRTGMFSPPDFFLCNAYRHFMTFAKWHLRVLEMHLSNVLWAKTETVLAECFPCAAFWKHGWRAAVASRRFLC